MGLKQMILGVLLSFLAVGTIARECVHCVDNMYYQAVKSGAMTSIAFEYRAGRNQGHNVSCSDNEQVLEECPANCVEVGLEIIKANATIGGITYPNITRYRARGCGDVIRAIDFNHAFVHFENVNQVALWTHPSYKWRYDIIFCQKANGCWKNSPPLNTTPENTSPITTTVPPLQSNGTMPYLLLLIAKITIIMAVVAGCILMICDRMIHRHERDEETGLPVPRQPYSTLHNDEDGTELHDVAAVVSERINTLETISEIDETNAACSSSNDQTSSDITVDQDKNMEQKETIADKMERPHSDSVLMSEAKKETLEKQVERHSIGTEMSDQEDDKFHDIEVTFALPSLKFNSDK